MAEEYGPFSIGTSPVMKEMIDDVKARKIDAVVFNLDTMLRNCISTAKTPKAAVEAVIAEKDDVIKEFRAIVDQLDALREFVVIFAIDTPEEYIPTKFLKTSESQQAHQLDAAHKMLASAIKVGAQSQVYGKVTAYLLHSRKEPYYATAVLSMKKHAIRGNVGIMSHHMHDLYMVGMMNSGYLYESFTGKVYDKPSFSKKVFNNPDLPFNTATHALFGDKHLMLPSAPKEVLKKITESAVLEKWTMKTERYVIDVLKRHNLMPPYTL